MGIDFPNAPVLDQIFGSGHATWRWDGAKWTAAGSTAGPFLPLTGGVVAGGVTIGADKPNYVSVFGGATSSDPAQIVGVGTRGDLHIGPAHNGQLSHYIARNWPTVTPELYRLNYDADGVVAAGQQPRIELHALNSDAVDASLAQGGGMSWFGFSGNLSAGAVGGRTAFSATLAQTGATMMALNQYYVGGAFWVDIAHSAGGTAGGGNARGSAFASNDGVLLRTGAGTFWNEVVGYELDIAAEAGTVPTTKQGMKIVFWSTDRVAGLGGQDYAYGIAAQGTCSGWDVGFCIGSSDGWWPMKSSATLIGTLPPLAGGPAYQAYWGIDYSAVTFSGGLIRGAGFSVDAAAHISAGSLTLNAAGLVLPTVVASSATDLSKQINLYNSIFGFSVTSNTNLNYNAGASGSYHVFYNNGVELGFIGSTGITSDTAVQCGGFSGPTWTSGSAAPSSTQPTGSLYSRTGSPTAGQRLYVSAGGGTWTPVAGV